MIEQSLTLAMWVFLRLQERDVSYIRELAYEGQSTMTLRIEFNPVHQMTVREDPYPGWKPPGNFPKGKRRWS